MKKLKKIVSSWRTALVLLGIYAVAMAAATFIEAAEGTETARRLIYHAGWFFVLHLLLILSFVAVSLRMRLVQRRRWGVLLLHYGFGVIILGAFITHVWGYEGYMHIREGETASAITIDKNMQREVPFSVTLDRFNLIRYPGSSSPSSYESEVVIRYEGMDRAQKIYMNNIARVGGFRIYQTSYDTDEKGTILTVSSDRWGTGVTYAGYLMLMVGLIVALVQPGSRFRTLYASLGKGVIVAVLFLFTALRASAQEVKLREVNPAQARRFGELLVQSPDGRIEPLNTYSSEILRKIYHKDRFRGMSSDQVLLGMLSDPYAWGQAPIIYISVPEVAEALGITGKYGSFQKLFDAGGAYRITQQVAEAYHKQPNERNKVDKEYMKLDEKVNILHAIFNGGMLPVFPDANGRWLSVADDVSHLQRLDSMMVKQVLPWYAASVAQGNYTEAGEAISILEKYQKAMTVPLHLNPKRIQAELLYNRADIFRYAFRFYLILGFLLMVVVVAALGKEREPGPGVPGKKRWWITLLSVLILGVFLYHTFGIGLRWYISGRAPWSNAYESMVYVGWTAVLAGLLFARRSKLVLALATLLGGVVLFVSNLNWLDPQITPLVPVLKSYWLMIHVSVITASYGFFGMCAMCGITSLGAMLAGRDLSELRKINEMAMLIGLVLLTMGIFFGAVWANESWGRYWGWDPKETWALITMIAYAFITHSRFIPRLNNPYAFATLSVAGFSTVLMTFFGVNYYLSGLHSYGKSGEVSFAAVGIVAAAVLLLIVSSGYKYRRTARCSEP